MIQNYARNFLQDHLNVSDLVFAGAPGMIMLDTYLTHLQRGQHHDGRYPNHFQGPGEAPGETDI